MNIPIGTLVTSESGGRGIVVPCTDEAFPDWVSVSLIDDHDWPGSIVTSHSGAFANDWKVIKPEASVARVVIMADMEGISTVPNDDAAVTPAEETGGVRTDTYAASCKAMTLDVQMAIAGARAAGAREIIVADSHWYDTNLSDEDFDVKVVRGSQAALSAMQSADAAMLIGWHAKAGTRNGCLPHTYSDRIKKLTIGGHEVGEIGMLSQLIASYGTPVVLVTGDNAACLEASLDVDTAERVVTKFVDERGVVKHRVKSQVWREIVGQALQAVIGLARGDRPEVKRYSSSEFLAIVHPGFEVASDDVAEQIGPGTYRMKATEIRSSYAAFQRFVDRLPAQGGARLAR